MCYMLYSKLDQQPNEAWGWDFVLIIREPHRGEDLNQWSQSMVFICLAASGVEGGV